MADALKSKYGLEIPQAIAASIKTVYPQFASDDFYRDVSKGYLKLELMQRGKSIARSLHQFLPNNFDDAIQILLNSVAQITQPHAAHAMASFIYLPHLEYVAKYGAAHFESSMHAQYILTQKFSAEFCIRVFLEKYPERCLAQLKIWAQDSNPHVRRLVSEGTRPRLPWASRLREFQRNPAPVLALLELLKDDDSLYVRRSVANNLNDIGKDHPKLLIQTAQRWMQNADANRTWIIKHALRSAIKRGDRAALDLFGFGKIVECKLDQIRISPIVAKIGGSVKFECTLHNTCNKTQDFLIDFCVHYVKANGKHKAKVFKLKTLQFDVGAQLRISKSISLAQMTTRKHYPGMHKIDLIINGVHHALGGFELRDT